MRMNVATVTNRISKIDALKGVLIILVILGHVLPGTLDENPIRGVIYYFHMPLFLAINGFFATKVVEMSWTQLYRYYSWRLILPFVIAFLAYARFFHFDFVRGLFYPFYHLWYIPAVLLFTSYLKGIRCLPSILGKVVVLTAFLLLTFFYEGHSQWELNMGWLKYLGDKRYYYFFSYFFLGYLLSGVKRFKFITPP